jgi:crotonobetainyl-CoA:carnitine CoA-transferase CaiB-like acyl-CoA transferase
MGAEIIKIEDPRSGGDIARYVGPFQEAEDSLFYETFNRNKKSISLDLSTTGGQDVFHDIVRVSDAVYSNLRGDVPEQLGLLYEQLKGVNKRIVCCSLSGFGLNGPRKAEPAYDYVIQGITGWMSLTGEPDGPPTKTGLSLVDYCAGLVAAMALLTGIHAARRDDHGMDCDLSLFDVAIGLLTYPATWYLYGSDAPERTANSAHPSLVPFQNFRTADGWIVIACAKEKFWPRLAKAIGRPELGSDVRFANFAARRRNRDVLIPLLTEVFSSQTTGFWLPTIQAAGVPVGPVNSLGQAIAETQTSARKMIIEVDHPRWGKVRQTASPLRVGDQALYRRAPFRNEHAEEVLRGILGYTAEQVSDLARAGAFGPS